eukprot:763329-Hanusia_phi.AAC.9
MRSRSGNMGQGQGRQGQGQQGQQEQGTRTGGVAYLFAGLPIGHIRREKQRQDGNEGEAA